MIERRRPATFTSAHGVAMSFVRPPWIGIGLVALAFSGCRGAESVAPRATVYFMLDAPLCSSIIPVQFSIDHIQVGTDTFVVNLAPEHTMSRGFETSVGQHTLSARAGHGYVWPDKSVTLVEGQDFTDTLPFYCS